MLINETSPENNKNGKILRLTTYTKQELVVAWNYWGFTNAQVVNFIDSSSLKKWFQAGRKLNHFLNVNFKRIT